MTILFNFVHMSGCQLEAQFVHMTGSWHSGLHRKSFGRPSEWTLLWADFRQTRLRETLSSQLRKPMFSVRYWYYWL